MVIFLVLAYLRSILSLAFKKKIPKTKTISRQQEKRISSPRQRKTSWPHTMCNYTNTHFECMRWTIIKELEPRNESCGRSACKYKAPAVPPPEKKEIEWTVKEVSVTPPLVEEKAAVA
ncbi:hypothetical protein BDD12DRAFT_435699 [Trichophaea hybrida]|nr:hypothetical protein BDD12DRAFT_435699 [Trichophaea hybrida]